MPISEEKLAHYEWAVETTLQEPSVFVRLLRLFEKYETIWITKKYSRAAQDLFSVAFSLWRAAFLAEKKSARKKVFADGKKFLEAIIQNNAIGYIQDYGSREWTFNYYTRNARDALENLHEYWGDITPPFEGKKRTAMDRWDYCHELLDQTVKNFEGRLQKLSEQEEGRRKKKREQGECKETATRCASSHRTGSYSSNKARTGRLTTTSTRAERMAFTLAKPRRAPPRYGRSLLCLRFLLLLMLFRCTILPKTASIFAA